MGGEIRETGVVDTVAIERVDARNMAAGRQPREQGLGGGAEADTQLDDDTGIEGPSPGGGEPGEGEEVGAVGRGGDDSAPGAGHQPAVVRRPRRRLADLTLIRDGVRR